MPESELSFKLHVDEETKGLQIENLMSNQSLIYSATNSSLFKLIWVVEGSCTLSADMHTFQMKCNEMILIKPGQPFVLNETLILKGYVILIPGFYFNAEHDEVQAGFSLLQLFNEQKIQLSHSCLSDLKETMQKMTDELNSENSLRVEIVSRYFKIFLLYLSRQLKEHDEKGNHPTNAMLAQRFISLLDKNFVTHKMVHDYARQLCITANYLNQVVKKVTGFSPSYHIRERIMLEARRKAYYSEKSMKEICYLLGFSDPAHFSKLFKKATGTNFANYRKKTPGLSFLKQAS